jgi:hypothetical protein
MIFLKIFVIINGKRLILQYVGPKFKFPLKNSIYCIGPYESAMKCSCRTTALRSKNLDGFPSKFLYRRAVVLQLHEVLRNPNEVILVGKKIFFAL